MTEELGPPVAGVDDAVFDPIDRGRLRALVRARVFGTKEPQRIGRYEVLREIGSGGMGVVYEAHDERLDRRLALKVVGHSGDVVAHERLQQEARALARLSHPNVVQVHDVGEWEGQVFLALELISGRTLQRWQIEDDPGWREVVARYREAAAGLAAAHAVGIVHRDFKPANALLGWDGRVRVLDFGLARPEAARLPSLPTDIRLGDPMLTKTGIVLGTPAYMAPEQAAGGEVDAAVDQFAFGVALFEALFGHRPFDGDSLQALRKAVATEPVRFPASHNVPARLRRVLIRLLQTDPARRFPDMDRVVDALDRSTGRRGWAALGVVGGLAAIGMAAAVGGAEPLDAPIVRPDLAPAATASERPESHALLRRADAMTLTAAREVLEEDPSRAVALLGELSPEGWTPAARMLAVEASSRGIATRQSTLPSHVDATTTPRTAVIQTRLDDESGPSILDLSSGQRTVLDGPAFLLWPEGGDFVFTQRFMSGRIGVYDVDQAEHRWLGDSTDIEDRWSVGHTDASATHVVELRDSSFRVLGADGSIREIDAPAGEAVTVVAATGGAALVIDRSAQLRYLGPESDRWVTLAEGVSDAQFGPSGARLVAATTTGELRAWSLDPTVRSHVVASPPDTRAAIVSSAGDRVAAWSSDGALTVFPWSGGPARIVGHTVATEPPRLQFSPSGQRLMAVGGSAGLQVIDLPSGRVWAPWGELEVSNASFTASGEEVVAFVEGVGIRHWSLDFDGVLSWSEHEQWVTAVAFADDTTLYTGGHDGIIRRWNADRGTSEVVRDGEDSTVLLAATAARVVMLDAGDHVVTWDARTRTEVVLGEDGATGLAVGADFVAWSDGRQVHRWDIEHQESLAPLPCPGCTHVEFSRDDHLLVAGPRTEGEQSSIARWEPHTGIERHALGPFAHSITALALGTDGDSAVYIDSRGNAHFASASAELPSLRRPEGDTWSFARAVDHDRFLLVTEGGTPSLWGPRVGSVHPVARPVDPVTFAVDVSSDGTRVAGGTEDGRVIVWRDRLPHDGQGLRAWARAATRIGPEPMDSFAPAR